MTRRCSAEEEPKTKPLVSVLLLAIGLVCRSITLAARGDARGFAAGDGGL